MAELTTDQQKAIAIAQAKRRRAEAEAEAATQEQSEPSGGITFFNKALAESLGAPVDVISAGLSKIG